MLHVLVVPELLVMRPYKVFIDVPEGESTLLALQRLVHGPIEPIDSVLPERLQDLGSSILVNEEASFHPGMFLPNQHAAALGINDRLMSPILGPIVGYAINRRGESASCPAELLDYLTEGEGA